MGSMGKVVVALGLVLVVAGGVMVLLGKAGITSLPGDLSFRRGRVGIFVPLGTSLVLSIVLTLLLNLFLRR